MTLIFGESFEAFGSLIWPTAAGQLASGAALGFGLLLRAEYRGRELFRARSLGAVASIVLVLALLRVEGIVGAAWGLAGGAAIASGAMAVYAIRPGVPSNGRAADRESWTET